jgi:beta-galactosidase
MYWRGILGQDLEPNRVYAEVAKTGEELARLSEIVTGLQFSNEAAILHSQDSHGALLDRPFSAQTDYAQWFLSCYRGFFRRSIGVDFLPASTKGFHDYKLVVIPALYICSDETLHAIVDYVREGGHVVMTFKSGFAEEHHTIRAVRMPGILREVCGFSYQEFSNTARLPVRHSFPGVPSGESVAGEFVEFLIPEGAQTLATYEHPFFEKFPAITRHRSGKGSVTYIGSVLHPGLLEAVLADAANLAGIVMPEAWTAPLLWRSALNAAGNRVHFGFNFSSTERRAAVPLESPALSLLDFETLQPGAASILSPWGVLIAEEKFPR